ncbi:MAG: N-acetylmuramoyl-L-alanine amidase [Clostridia bacterium]|nr:N-acetylmuramoyl-L-alanine amidase [Clostridia bacterium]
MGKMLKERLMITGCAFAVLLLLAAVSPRPAKPAVPARPVMASCLNGMTICVDAGHGGKDGGARAMDSRVWEREMNLAVAKQVQEKLEQRGVKVIMTRTGESTFSDEKREDLTQRMELAREEKADLLLSIHMNEYRSRKESGPQVFYRMGQEESRLLAGTLQSALIETLQPEKKRSALAGDYYILSMEIPSVLIECGFLSNSAEEKKLLDENYQSLIADAVADGVEEFVRLRTGLDGEKQETGENLLSGEEASET